MDKRLVKIGETARLLGADPVTLRKWEGTGELLPARKTKGGTRYHDVSGLMGFTDTPRPIGRGFLDRSKNLPASSRLP